MMMNNVNGILLVNKPKGLTSNAVLQRVKRMFGAKKAGHTGSLDPLATGMLPICFGEATKLSQYLLDADKCYEATGLLGVKTTTGDAQGEVLTSLPDFSIAQNQLQEAIQLFRGAIEQKPSMFSALKHQGIPLYRYARAGVEIERKVREVNIHKLELLAFDGTQFKISVLCSKGTYIRNLIEDIGEFLNVGAHVVQLHRVYTAGFCNEPMYDLDVLSEFNDAEREQLLLPMERPVMQWPSVVLNSSLVRDVQQGKTVTATENVVEGSWVRLYNEGQDFIGLGEVDSTNRIQPRRLIAQ